MQKVGVSVTLVIFFTLLALLSVGRGVEALRLKFTLDEANSLIAAEDNMGVEFTSPLKAEDYFRIGRESLKDLKTGMAVICFKAACALDPKFSKPIVSIYKEYSAIYEERGDLTYTDYFVNLAKEFEKGG